VTATARLGAPQIRASEGVLRRRIHVPLMPTLPAAVIGVIVVAAVFAPLLTSYDPVKQDLRNTLIPPFWVAPKGSLAHILGTDGTGRDIVARLLFGARVSLLVAFLTLFIASLIGTLIGVVSGYVGGNVDAILMRFTDAIMAFPSLIVALVFAALLGPSFTNMVIILSVLTWPRIARLVRGETLTLRHSDFIKYSRAIGTPSRTITVRHVLPNVLPIILVAATLEVGHVILAEASLSFLGAGLPAPQASWGVMIADGRALVASGWWIALFPGIAITASVLSLNALGDWLRDRLDPKTGHG
jgi:peptide/nickel transport system permease protein